MDESIKTRDAYSKQPKIGQRTLLDLLNIEYALYDAQRNLLNSDFDVYTYNTAYSGQ